MYLLPNLVYKSDDEIDIEADDFDGGKKDRKEGKNPIPIFLFS